MREHLIQYVGLLFAGASGAEDIQQEILQNTLDRYDDLISQGKSPEAAYQLAISGIGDIREILGGEPPAAASAAIPAVSAPAMVPVKQEKPAWKKLLLALGICLYILSPVPLFALEDTLGLCGLLAICAVATGLVILSGGRGAQAERKNLSPRSELEKALCMTVSVVCLCFYFGISFLTGAWYITWVIFPLCGAVNGLIRACFDLKEASKHEN